MPSAAFGSADEHQGGEREKANAAENSLKLPFGSWDGVTHQEQDGRRMRQRVEVAALREGAGGFGQTLRSLLIICLSAN